MNIALCFCVKDCEKYLPSIFKNIALLKSLDYNFFCIFSYDNCKDKSEKLLLEYKELNKDTVFLIKNIDNNSEFRTARIAKARNACLDIVYNKLKDISFHIMIDSDDSCSNTWKIDIIDKYLKNFDGDDWDAISFNKKKYYDMWALLFDDYYHQCWGYGDGGKIMRAMQKDIIKKLQNLTSNSTNVLSAFNGFAIYKTERFKGFHYDGLNENFHPLITNNERNISIDFITKKHNLKIPKDINILQKNKQCCEHLFYNVSAFKKGRKIKISKFSIM